ncbi:hypothetical protein J3459_007574 [Metarhizium acridum]|nr:hypothetical protein J3459_007574 [Metarhizium acridum]
MPILRGTEDGSVTMMSISLAIYSLGRWSEVVGIGTVCLTVENSLTTKGPGSHGILRLRNVLHVPAGGVNVIGDVISDDFYLQVCAPTAKVAAQLISRKKGQKQLLFSTL